MASLSINGPDKEVLTKSEVASYLRLGSERSLDRMISSGTFPRGIKMTPQGEPVWLALDIAAYLHLAPRMRADEKDEKTDA